MKTNYISFILMLGLALLFHSCEKEIEFSGEITKPMLVINSFITPDSVIKVHLSKSKFFLEDNTTFEMVNNANVNVWVNGSKVEKLTNTGEGYYLSSFKPLLGDIIKITAETSDMSEVSTVTEIVQPNPIISVDTLNHQFKEYPMVSYSSTNNGPYIADTMGLTKIESFGIKVKFNDPSTASNYYRLEAKVINYYDDGSVLIGSGAINYNDIVFGGNNNSSLFETSGYNYYHEFSDELFNGKEYNLNLTFNRITDTYKPEYQDMYHEINVKTPVKQELRIELQSISKSYFLYLRSRAANMSAVEFFSEPVQIYSNVTGGIGILGSYSSSVYILNLK
ncbi:MAG TPA: DUF4249 domain-containing protein [Paludibacter sp.]